MVYTDGKILMADTDEELHEVAEKLGLGHEQFVRFPFPCYLMEVNEWLLNTQNIRQMSTTEMMYRHHAVRKSKVLDYAKTKARECPRN